jgi:hypothetical protein
MVCTIWGILVTATSEPEPQDSGAREGILSPTLGALSLIEISSWWRRRAGAKVETDIYIFTGLQTSVLLAATRPQASQT